MDITITAIYMIYSACNLNSYIHIYTYIIALCASGPSRGTGRRGAAWPLPIGCWRAAAGRADRGPDGPGAAALSGRVAASAAEKP